MTSLTMGSYLKRLSLGLGLLTGLVSANSLAQAPRWQPIGISGGGGMFAPAISPANPNLMMLNCDMSAAYISEDGGLNWRMIHQAQLRSDTACRPAFHPTDPNILYASSGGRLKISRDRGKTFAPSATSRTLWAERLRSIRRTRRLSWPARAVAAAGSRGMRERRGRRVPGRRAR